MFAQLIPVSGGQPVTIDRDVSVVGRQRETCDIVLEGKSVSKIHCILVRTDGLLLVRDLFSTNGIKVNGQRIVRGALIPGDVLSLAGEKFRIHLGPAPVNGQGDNGGRTEVLDVAADSLEPEVFVESDPPLPPQPRSAADRPAQAAERPGMAFVVLPPGGVALERTDPEDLVE